MSLFFSVIKSSEILIQNKNFYASLENNTILLKTSILSILPYADVKPRGLQRQREKDGKPSKCGGKTLRLGAAEEC